MMFDLQEAKVIYAFNIEDYLELLQQGTEDLTGFKDSIIYVMS